MMQPSQPAGPLAAFFEAAREAILVVDSNMRIAVANPSARDAFSRLGGELEGRRISEVIRDAQIHNAFQTALFQGGSTDINFEFIGRTARNYDVRISPVDLGCGKTAVGIFYDITKLERLERMRQEFLSNISHELRTPLTSILAFVETLEDGAIDDKENNRRFLNTIRRNAERMSALIADILELSMIETGKVSIEKRSVKVAAVVDGIFASVAGAAVSREISLINDIDPDSHVSADPIRLEQMLTNLVDNAIKFNRDGGTVTVSLENTGASDILQVADSGEGILPSQLSRVFERFYRADRGRTREVGGTGLGLAIVKHLARLHGGEARAASELGKGTVFSIELPRPAGDSAA